MKLTEAELLRESYLKGYIDAIRNWAWWKNGQQYVGSCGMTLPEAVDGPERELFRIEAKRNMMDPDRRIRL